MVDIIKCLPPLFPRIRNRSHNEPISLPNFFSTINHVSRNERLNINNNGKRWIGRYPRDPYRSDPPYNSHQKVILRELSRYYLPTITTTVDASVSTKIKQQQQQQKNSNKEPLKVTTVTSNLILSNVTTTSSHLFDAFSKHVTIKAEPLRTGNNFVNNTSNALYSWQNYWASTQTKRRRKETNDSDSVLPRLKRDHTILTTTHFVTVRNTLFHSTSRTPSTIPDSCTPRKLSPPVVCEKQSSFIKEDQFSLSPIILSREKTPPMNSFKSVIEKPLSPIRSESAMINDDNEIDTITTKIYKLPLPTNKPKINKSISKIGSQSKSLEKKSMISSTFLEKKEKPSTTSVTNTSVAKQRHQTSLNKSHRSITKKQEQSLSRIITTIPRSKYERRKWDEPYIGRRLDPPTPSPSPSLFVWPQDSDPDENDVPYEQNSTNERFL